MLFVQRNVIVVTKCGTWHIFYSLYFVDPGSRPIIRTYCLREIFCPTLGSTQTSGVAKGEVGGLKPLLDTEKIF